MLILSRALNSIILIIICSWTLACSSDFIDGQKINTTKSKDHTSESDSIPNNVKKLMASYSAIVGYRDNHLLFADSSKMIYDDKKTKSQSDLLNAPDIEDMFFYTYRQWPNSSIPQHYNPGRIRNEEFFKKIYGNSKDKVQQQLAKINWCPKLVNQVILVTKVNNLHVIVDSLSKELDKHPEFKKYLENIGGTFNWRLISGTNRLSMHSFGMTIDINVKYSNYWQWDCQCKDENTLLNYKNGIPLELVKIFEKYGFIWGGNWYHYDTMHFEYRPELL